MSKVKDLPEIITLDDNDLLYTVDNSEGTNGGRKITKENLKESVKQSDSEIKTAYENNADTNVYTDSEKTKLDGIESGATADQSASEIKIAYESNANTNEFTDAEKTKLGTVESGATGDQDSDEVNYDNNASGLSATDVKSAIDELVVEKENVFSKNTAFNKNFGTSAGTVLAGDDERLSTAQRIQVKLDPGVGEFSSIKAAIDSISDASSSKPYQVNIGPGIYIEDTITIPSHVHVRGERDATVVRANDANNDIFVLNSNVSVAQLKVEGATGLNAAAFRRTGGTTNSYINIVDFGSNYYQVVVDSTAGQPSVLLDSCRIGANVEFQKGFTITGNGTGELVISNLNAFISGAGINPDSLIEGEGVTNIITLTNLEVKVVAPASLINGIKLQDGVGSLISSTNIISANTGLFMPNVGVGCPISATGLAALQSSVLDINVEHPNTIGTISGTWSSNSTFINDTASENMNIVYTGAGSPEIGLVAYGDILQGLSGDRLINISKLNREEATLGLISGGEISGSINPFDVSVSAGNGFLKNTPEDATIEVSWDTTLLTIATDTASYITVNSSGTVQAEASLPEDLTDRIILGRVITGDSTIVGIDASAVTMVHHGNLVERYLRNTFGAIYASGSIVSENASTDRALDVSGGEYFYGTKRFSPSGGTEIQFALVYRDGSGDFNTVPLQTQLDQTVYDNDSGTPVAVPAGEYTKGVLIGGGEGASERYAFVMSQQTYANENDAVAGPLPLLPNEVTDALTIIAEIILKQDNNNIIEILDVRPTPSFKGASGSSSSDHGGLTGLTDDDHPQYLLSNGGRTLTGNLNLGNNNITNINTINSIDITSHASRHLPNGADPITTAAPLTNLSGNTTNSTGTANSLSRSDHTHTINSATTSIAGLMSASDKTKINTVETNAAADQDADEVPYDNSSSGLVATEVQSAIDEVEDRIDTIETNTGNHLNGDPGKHDANEVDYERDDLNKTDIDAASDTVELALNDLDDIKLSRTGSQAMTGDLDLGTNDIINVGTVDGVDVSSHASRHLPDGLDSLATAAPSTPLSGNTSNDVGSANSFSRSDHSHEINDATISIGGLMSSTDKTKLDGIESGATADQTGSEIKSLYEGETNTNAFTDAEKSKLAGLETSKFLGEYASLGALQTAHPSPAVGSYANVDGGMGSDVERYVWDSDDSAYVRQLGVSSLLTDSQIKTQYENNADTNAFTDADETKLDGIESGATADQTGAEIKVAYEAEANTNAFTDAEQTKLSGIEANAEVNDAYGGTPPSVAASGSAGVAVTKSRSDHTHAHGNQAGGSLHSDVTTSTSGFMSAADKSKIDGMMPISIYADQFENPWSADWDVSEIAPLGADTANSAILSRRFDDTDEEGVGATIFIPTNAVNVTFRFVSRAQTAPPAARTVGIQLYRRAIPNTVGTWTNSQLDDINIPNNTQWQYSSQTVTLASIGLTAGVINQLEITRVNPSAGTELVGDWNLMMLQVEFS